MPRKAGLEERIVGAMRQLGFTASDARIYLALLKRHPATGYERLLHDALHGDQTLFMRSDSVQRAWEVVQPVLDEPPPITFYAAGSWGPREADTLLERDGNHWRKP